VSLNDFWFGLFILIIAGYVILDGFDLGVGMLDLFVARTDDERRQVLNSIGPIWDGNEVWLVVGGGVLFAAFPMVYAAMFSGFYWALMLVLVFLILRTVAIEFRGKRKTDRWRRSWDFVFALASFMLVLLLGVALGNVVVGVPLSQAGDVTITVVELLKIFPVVVGLTAIAMLALHGGLYLAVKTTGPVYDRVRALAPKLAGGFAVLGLIAVTMMFSNDYDVVQRFKHNPVWLLVPIAAVAAFGLIWFYRARGRDVAAFFSSSVMLGLLLISAGIGMYPNLLLSSTNPAYNMTATNAASQQLTLEVMLVVALIGLPFVILYTSGVQYLFRGKVELTPDSY
jgi:cytochrome bd ubiquinol oxidase subunit II